MEGQNAYRDWCPLADLEADWETIDPKEIGKPVKGIHNEDAEIFEKEIEDKKIVCHLDKTILLPSWLFLTSFKMRKLDFPEAAEIIEGQKKQKHVEQADEADKEEDNKRMFAFLPLWLSVYLDHINNVDEFFGTKKKKEDLFNIAQESEKQATEEEITQGVKEAGKSSLLRLFLPLERFAYRFQQRGTNDWRFFRVNEGEKITATEAPTATSAQTMANLQAKTTRKQYKDPVKQLRTKQTQQTKPEETKADDEWKRREDQIKALEGLKKKGRKKTVGNFESDF